MTDERREKSGSPLCRSKKEQGLITENREQPNRCKSGVENFWGNHLELPISLNKIKTLSHDLSDEPTYNPIHEVGFKTFIVSSLKLEQYN